MMSGKIRRVIVDVDTGVDDFIALAMLLVEKDVKIEAVTCVNGNTTLDNAAKNTAFLLDLMNRKDIPVYKGASEELLPMFRKNDYLYHGTNGLMGIDIPDNLDGLIRPESAIEAIYEIVSKYPGEIILICLGPLTNIALVQKIYPDFSARLKEMWIMGGNKQAVGNITPQAEFNFFSDPEAAHIVLENISCETFLLPWETTMEKRITKSSRWSIPTEGAGEVFKLITKLEHLFLERPLFAYMKYWNICDPTLVAAFINPEKVITRTSKQHALVELHGCYTRGQMVIDHSQTKKKNIVLIEQINDDEFLNVFLKLREY